MKIEKRLILPLVLITILSTIFLASISGTAEAQTPAQLTIVPSDYTYIANFTSPPSFLAFNISLTNVTSLGTWQASINWDPNLLSYKNASVPPYNIFGSEPVIATSITDTPGAIIYGSALLDPTHAVNGSGVLFQLELNVLNQSVTGTSDIIFAGIASDTFLLDGTAIDIPFGHTNSKYANIYLTGTAVTHAIPGSSRPVTTTSNGTIQPNSGVINTVNKTISFNVTGSPGATAFLHVDLPKNVINVTNNNLTRWNVSLNGVTAQPQITQNDTDTFMFAYITFASDVTVGVKGDNIIPELSSMLIILIIASSITVAVAKSRTRKK